MKFKSVTLDEKSWASICALISTSPVADDYRFGEMIREQLDGSIRVKVTRGSVSVKAKKGGDVRDSLSMPWPDAAI